MISLRYVGAVNDSSGYASAARGYINALIDTQQVNLTVRVASFEKQKTDHGDLGERIKPYIERPVEVQVQILHLTPENYPSYSQMGMYNIGYVAWETERLPDGWADLINTMDEVWVPSQWNVEVFRESGVVRPLKVVPHVIAQPSPLQTNALAWPIHNSDAYVFYSIFQWLERKNPGGLLKAYLTEFTEKDQVYLALKTYRLDCGPAERQVVKTDIDRLKKSLNLSYYPPIVFFGDLLTREQMESLHQQGHCYALLQRGEGFGIPLAQAMAHGKPVITTQYGGCLDFMNDKNSFLVPCQRTPVSSMIFPNYNAKMIWAEPDLMEARRLMRYCYEHRDEAKAIGKQAREDIAHNLNSKVIGDLMIQRLNEIIGQ